MPTNLLNDGMTMTVAAPTGGYTQGAIYKGTDRGGVILETVTGGASVAVALEGAFQVTKKAGANLDFAVGEKVCILTTGGVNKAVPYATGNPIPLGHAIAAAVTGATTVNVKLDTF